MLMFKALYTCIAKTCCCIQNLLKCTYLCKLQYTLIRNMIVDSVDSDYDEFSDDDS